MKLLLIFSLALVFTTADDSQALKDFVAGNVQYVGSLYKELANKEDGNFLVCPLSIQSVFALINGGAKGETAKQITTALHLPEGEENVKKVFTDLTNGLQASDEYTLTSANKVYLANYFKISSGYKTTAVEVFNSGIQNIDFSKTDEALEEINGWVEEKTHKKIKDLVKRYMIGPDTAAVLVNALYFQGTWYTKFGKVFKAPFRLNNQASVTTNMMNVYTQAGYYESKDMKAKYLELHYKGEQVSLIIALPYETEGLSGLEERVPDVFSVSRFIPTMVNITIPKFKIETETHLIPILERMGIHDAFTGAADFTGIGENQERISITEAIQKAFIDVNEEGTVAAAATAISTGRSGRIYEEAEFVADHPFIFYLKHRRYGIFFVGRYLQAKEAV